VLCVPRSWWLLCAALIACGARSALLGEAEERLPADASTPFDASVPKDAGPDVAVPKDGGFDAPDVACDACLRILTYDEVGYQEVHAPEGTMQQVGPAPDGFWGDIALAPDRKTLYGSGYGGLATIDMSTWKTVSTIRITDPEQFNALEFGPDGTLYGAQFETVYTIDPQTGRTTSFATLPSGLHSAGDIGFVGPRFFITTYLTTDVTAMNKLVEIDIPSTQARVVGDTGAQCIFGLAGTDTALYGLTCNAVLLQLDISSGAAKVLAKLKSRGFDGATHF
jgi:hypothetical protein